MFILSRQIIVLNKQEKKPPCSIDRLKISPSETFIFTDMEVHKYDI